MTVINYILFGGPSGFMLATAFAALRGSELVDFYADRGIKEYVLWLVSLTDQNRENVRSLVRVSTMRPFIEAACKRGEARGVDVRSRHIPRCQLLGLEDHLVEPLAPGLHHALTGA